MDSETLLGEDEVLRRLKLDSRPSPAAQRKALDRLWRTAQTIRKDLKQPPLRRVRVGARYLYEASMVDELIETLAGER